MALVPTREIVDGARRAGCGVAAFNVIQIEHAEAYAAAAERVSRPVVLQVSQNCVRYHGALAPLGAAVLAVARRSAAPIAVHLDHAESAELVREAVTLGFGSVMFDASRLDYADNLARTREVARHCHERSLWVEAELGEIGGKDGAHAPGVRTDPGEAASFVAATGVDALAVAVGSSHAMTERTAALDFELITRLRDALPVPLVLHGSSGVADADLAHAVAAGMTKVNVATRFNRAFTAAARAYLADHPEVVDPRRYLRAARDAVADEAVRLLDLITR